MRRCVWSRNLKNEVMARVGPQRHKKKSKQMSKPMQWTHMLRTCIGVYPAQISKLYFAQMSRLYRALVPNPSAQMSILRRYRSILCPDVYAFITRRSLNIYPRRCLCLYYPQVSRPISCADVYVCIIRRCLDLHPAQMPMSILCAGV